MLSKIFSRTIFLLILLPICSITILAQTNQEQELTIAGITVSGNVYADTETIISISGLRVGNQIKLINDFAIQRAIQNLWKRKQFSFIDIKIEKITPMGIFLNIIVEEFPRLSSILIYNNKEIDEFEIKKATGKIKGDIISNNDLQKAKDEIIKLYEKEGISFVEVDIKTEVTDTSHYVNLLIDINEGAAFKVNSINFVGNHNLSSDDLAGSFKETSTKSWWQIWKSAKFDKKKYDEDKKLLVKYMQNQGYIDASLIGDSLEYNPIDKTVNITLQVDEGPRVYIRNIKFEGNLVFDNKVLERRLEFKKGDYYNLEEFQMNLSGNQNQTDAASLYMDNGYLQARLMPEVYRVPPDSVDITVKVFEGDRVRFGKIEIVGNTKTKDKVIRRELYTKPGDYFDRSAIIRSIRALQVMQYFNPETLRPDVKPSQTDNTSVDLIYKVEERSTDTFNASIGFAGTFGLTGSVGFTFNNFSIAEPLRGGAGQVFNFQWEFGQANRYRTFSLGLTEPWLFDEPTTVGFSVFDSYYNFLDLNQSRTGVGLNIGRRFKWPDDFWRGDWSIRAQINDNKTGNIYYRQGKYNEITIGQRFSRISINNMFFPSTGSKFTYSTDFAMGAIGLGEIDYFKNELNFEIFSPLAKIEGSDRLVFMLGSKIGYINGFNSDTTISPIELYRMGGNGLSGFTNVTPLRGYPDSKLGTGYGDKFLMKYTAELRFAISLDPMPVYVYGFAEAGNIFKDFQNTDPFNLKRSAGVGVQLMIAPIGVVGFSYGYGFDKYADEADVSGWRFLFHLGQ
ncbi:MAG TPA: outer membrane protein assembly factor BamA [Candidatus Kapabacteria bacterium]|nr:outer membrane protein assembly factor BamA [Candidatus Kapabacteria bacterium]